MLARLTITLAYLLTILNLQFVFHVDRMNPIEKSLFLAAALVFVLTRQVSRTIILLWALCTGMIVILGALTTYAQFEWGTLLMALNQIMIIYAMLAIKPTRADRDYLLLAGALIPIVSVLLGYVYQGLGIWHVYQQEYNTGLARMSGSVIAAYLSAFAMCGTFAAVLLATIKQRPWFYVLAVVNLCILLLAGGRAALAVTLPICAVAFLRSSSTPIRMKVTGVIVGVAGLAFVMATVGRTAIERLMVSNDNGRTLLWEFALNLGKQHPWTGVGFGHAYWATPRSIQIMTSTRATHNDYIRLIAELGYIGMPLFYLFLVLAVFRVWLAGQRNILPWMGLLGFMFVSQADNALTTPGEFLLIIFGVLANAHVMEESRPVAQRLWRRIPRPKSSLQPAGHAPADA